MFSVSQAKKQVLAQLAERDMTAADLATELDKSPAAIYNHLNDLAEQGILTTRQVPATTRPETVYGIADGFLQYVVVLPGQVQEGAFALDDHKEPLVRIWTLPQAAFHPFLQEYWFRMTHSPALDVREDIRAVGVYGSVARGEADAGSDIDVLIVTADGETADTVTDQLGSVRIERDGEGKIVLAEVYGDSEFRDSWVYGSQFLREILPELHPIYDPDRILTHPDGFVEERATVEASSDE